VTKKEWWLLIGGVVLFVSALGCELVKAPAVVTFGVSAAALGIMASLVGEATDHLGDRFSPSATGVIQSALGNLPELFFAIFALRAGLDTVVAAALVGSVLGNALLVLGAAFVVGGLRHKTQKFPDAGPNQLAILLLLGVAVLAVPSLTSNLHLPVANHEHELSLVASVVLLVLYVITLLAARDGDLSEEPRGRGEASWPLGRVLAVLIAASVGAAFVSDWFVSALTPALHVLHMSEAFAGFVVVAIAGNAVENVVGIQMAAQNKASTAVSVIVQSPLQIIYVLFPAVVLLSTIFHLGAFTLVLSPQLLIVLALATVLVAVVVIDGESTWPEGAALMALYVVIATTFWWG
jgi:Ca2+:H+ antiporter